MTMRTSGASEAFNKKNYENRVPDSQKYAHIGSKLNSGLTQSKVKYLTNRQVLRRRDEIFLRISPNDLAELFEEYEKIDDERVEDNVCGGNENGPKICVYEEEAKVQYERPYLLLDVRQPNEYATCHILQARSMPQRMLMQDKVHPDMYSFRNKEGRLIVLYDDAERLAAAAAHQLVHRGFDNVYILSRGICGFADKFPQYVEGDVEALPEQPDSPKKPSSRSSSSSSSSRSSTASTALSRRGGTASSDRSSRMSTTSSRRFSSKQSSRMRDDDQLSRMSELSIADSVISRCQTRKSRV